MRPRDASNVDRRAADPHCAGRPQRRAARRSFAIEKTHAAIKACQFPGQMMEERDAQCSRGQDAEVAFLDAPHASGFRQCGENLPRLFRARCFQHEQRLRAVMVDRRVGVFDIDRGSGERLRDRRESAQAIGRVDGKHFRLDDRKSARLHEPPRRRGIAREHSHHALLDVVDDADGFDVDAIASLAS